MQPDVWVSYEHMYRSRLFEEAVSRQWNEGRISREMHLSIGEEAVVWTLPLIFVCKDSKWAITTVSATVTEGKLTKRAESFGMPAVEIDGMDAEAVWYAARDAMKRARNGRGPSFLLAACPHPVGHPEMIHF